MIPDGDLLEKALELDREALTVIFDRYYNALYRYIYCHIHHQSDAEDLASQVFQRLLTAIQDGKPPRDHLRGWLYRVAYNLIVDYSRRQQFRNHDALPETLYATNTPIEAQVAVSLQAESIQAALQQLTDDQRHILILRFIQGLSLAESAEVLQRTVGAVKALQHRALQSIRGILLKEEAQHNG